LHKRFIDELLKDAAVTVVDAGARDGFSLLQPLHPCIELHAFEPDPASFQELQHRYAAPAFRKVVVSDLALASQAGKARFYSTRHPSLSSLLKPDVAGYRRHVSRLQGSEAWADNLETTAQIEVRTETLDRWASEHAIGFIDFLKLDTQGTELDILRGAGGLLAARNIGVVYAEVTFLPLYEGQCSFAELDLWMRQCGYRLAGLFTTPLAGSAAQRTLISADALYVQGEDATCRRPASAALLLACLGQPSLAEHLIRTHGLLNAADTEALLREVARRGAGQRLKQYLRGLAPPLLLEWYGRVVSRG
jgi:FkbM family methyltransferase